MDEKREEADALARFLNGDMTNQSEIEDKDLMALARALEEGAVESNEEVSRRRVWNRVRAEGIAAKRVSPRRYWRPALATGAVAAVVALVALFLLASQMGGTRTVSAAEIVEKARMVAVDPSANKIKSYEITQITLKAPGLPAGTQPQAHIWHEEPNKWRIETDNEVIVADAGTTWTYYPQRNLVQISNSRTGGPSQEGTDLNSLLEQRSAEGSQPSLVGEETVAGQSAYVLNLSVPKGSLTIWVDKETFFVLRSILRASSGDVLLSTEVTNVRYNAVLDASLFTIVYPGNAVVQDLRGRLAPTPSPGPPATVTPPPGIDISTWNTYRSLDYGFELRYPQEGKLSDEGEGNIRIDLPFAADTNLVEKYLEIAGRRLPADLCVNPFSDQILQTDVVRVGDIQFRRDVGSGVAAGSTYDSVAYSTTNGPLCLSLTLVLHSVNPGAMQTPAAAFDKEQESAVLAAIISTFKWTGG